MNEKTICGARNVCWCFRLLVLAVLGFTAATGQVTPPSHVKDCHPCTFSPGAGLPPYSFTFELKTSGGERAVEAIKVTRPESEAPQTLPVIGMDPIGQNETFFFGGVDINFDGYLDLILVTAQGGANSQAAYWLFDPDTKTFKPLGTYPMFTVDKEKQQLTMYSRGGYAGLSYDSRTYRFLHNKLTLVREEKQRPTPDPEVFLKVIRERVGDTMKTVKSEKIRVPK
jgi:hypothetical protein